MESDDDVHADPDQELGDGGVRWVVGVDGSECSRHAALWAVAQGPERAQELQLATAWSLPVSTAMTPMSPLTTSAAVDALEQAATETVDELARSLGASIDIPVTRSVGQGGASSLLLDAARNSSLLIVGSRGRGGFARLLLGSTSTQCATHSATPVAVIPTTAPISPIGTIVVAFDGSVNSIAALEWAVEFAAPDSTINCVSVWDTTPIAIGGDQFFFPDANELAQERFDHLVTRTVGPIERADIDLRRSFVEGQPRAVLAEMAAEADLLVVGARGHSAVGAAVLGSVSTWLLHHAERAMVVVPQPSVRPDDLDIGSTDEED